MNVGERVSYLKGLMEGMKLDTESDQGKILSLMADILEDLAAELAETQDDLSDLGDYVEAMDEDLTTVEDEVFEGDEIPDDEDEEEDGDYYEVTCPSCGTDVCFEEMPEGETAKCPSCGKEIPLE